MKTTFLSFSLLISCSFASLNAEDAPSSSSSYSSILAPKNESDAGTSPSPASPTPPETALPSESMNIPGTEPMKIPSYEGTFVKMILTLAGLIGLVILTVWLLKKLTQGRIGAFGKKNISVLERRPLSPKTVLYVIEMEGKRMLVAESQLEIKTLATIEAPTEEA
ncbi:MAG: hypothetical protein EBZ47_06315 [Chlamydiae bacterium]|nr:hypothetical protein [Chlamydiota bacterium]